jgi:D-alanyl-D-alanine carboxypeptidase (penicillin-binding protein 5/6)
MLLKSKIICFTLILILFQVCFSITSFAESENILENAIGSPSCILMEASTGEILYEKNAYDQMFPASTTKIMTAILTVENCNLDEVATASHNAIYSVPSSYSHASIVEGEELTVENLLNVLLIPSANDAANVLAEHIGGSIENFAQMMNDKATEIGCKNTHFVNANGVHSDDHYSTAYDLALMGQYAMKNDTIRSIVKKTQCSLPKTNKYDKEDRVFTTSNELLKVNNSDSKSNYYYQYANGIKTGYTTEAGSCIIASAKKDGMEVIAVILGAQTTSDGYSIRYPDCKTLFNYAFDNYKLECIVNTEDVVTEVNIPNATQETSKLSLLPQDKIVVLVDKNYDLENLEPDIQITKSLTSPISAGEIMGTVTYTINNTQYSTNLVANNSVVRNGVYDILFKICLIILALTILALLLSTVTHNKSKKGKKKKKRVNYKHLKLY